MDHKFLKIKKEHPCFHKIRHQAVLLLIIFILIPMVALQLVNIYVTEDYTFQKNQAILSENLMLSRELLNNYLSTYKEIYFNISSDANFMSNMVEFNRTEKDTMIYRRISASLDTTIVSNTLLYPEIQAVGVIGTNHVPYIYVYKSIKNHSIEEYFNAHYQELEQLDDSSRELRTGVIPASDPNYNEETPSFFIRSTCINYERLAPMGTLILFINPEKIGNAINNPTSQVYEYTSRILINRDQEILCDKNNLTGYLLSNVDEYSSLDPDAPINDDDPVELPDAKLFSRTGTELFDLNILNIIDYNKMNHSLVIFWITIVSLLVLILGITFFLVSLLVGEKFISPIEKIAKAMKSLDGSHLNERIPILQKNEIGDIERSYNEMLNQIQTLLEENRLQTEHLLEMNNIACNEELKSLELQINPHFIFNTLDTINWTAIRDGSIEVSRQLNGLATILRYTVYNINHIVPLSDDIDWIHQYLHLQKIRFSHSFSYDIFADNNTLQLKIHKLLLQPFLENALIHGFDGITWPGYLRIDCNILCGKILRIQITDNGCGISPEKLEEIRRLFSDTGERNWTFSNSIGLSNIAWRTRKYYKSRHIMVSSGHKCTCFKLFIPVQEMEAL